MKNKNNSITKEKDTVKDYVLPNIIADKTVFAEMLRNERVAFYSFITKNIKDENLLRGYSSFKRMLLEPEDRLNHAFLDNKRKSTKLWCAYTSILELSLKQFLTKTLDLYKKTPRSFSSEKKTLKNRVTELEASIKKYI